MPGSTSVQLPDLLGLSRAFDLRTNRHCYTVTAASEKSFVTEQNDLSDDERAALGFMKIGLWASTCFPTCDPPQLRLATDFLTLLVVCNCRLAQAQTLRECGWIDEQPSDSLSCLSKNSLFRELMQKMASAMPSESSRHRFIRSAEAFRAAQTQMISYRDGNSLPDVEAYVDLRRDLSGISMVFDLLEMAEGLQMTSDDQKWNALKHSAADIIALSTDVVAYNNDQFIDNRFNIVSIVGAEKGLSVQGAINHSFSLIDQSLHKFLAAESALSLEQPIPRTTTSMWMWNPLSRKELSNTTPQQVPLSADSKLYLRGLKDCIVGTLNWVYETELYFGSKGDEIRQFGWVFLKIRGTGNQQG
ncbi:isoprenoid synthase domain-containing protein [Mycena capillaripes]|nr:isoprenoid synthase domain-containing protein [Mycena capillaripes]